MSRTVREVFEDHLSLRLEGKTNEDIEKNYSKDCVAIGPDYRFEGYDGLRESAKKLAEEVGDDAEFEYVREEVEWEFAYLVWKSKAKGRKVEHGVDSFLIRDGKIVVQSIFYKVEKTD